MNRYLYLLQCIVLIIGFSYQTSAQYISTYAGNGSIGYAGDGGAATSASLDTPTALAMDGSGNLYINDQRNNCIRKVTPAGIITTVAGNGSTGYSGDNGPATNAMLGLNWGVAVDAAGNIYITDQNNYRVRKVNTAGIITTIAGNGTRGYSGDGGAATAAKLVRPIGIAVDAAGNVFIADADTFCIRKVTPAGTISTYAGNALYGFGGDGGQATAASLSTIWGLATDPAGNLYICDGNNNRIRVVNTSGIINTIAGNSASPGFGGDGGPAVSATLNQPLGIYVTGSGVVYFSDCKNNRVRKISKAGIISTIAGTGTPGYNGDGIPATTAQLSQPIGVAMDTNENIYVADMRNGRIRMINNIVHFVFGDDEHLAVCQNSGPTPINTILSIRNIYVGVPDVWTLETPPVHGTAVVGYSAISSGGTTTPSGLTYTPTFGYAGLDSFTVKVANSFSSDLITIYVTVDPLLVPGVISGPSSVCVGSSILLTNIATGGTWSSANGLLALTVTDTGCHVKGLTAGIDTIKYRVTNACGTAVTVKAITVNPLPDAGSIAGPPALCLGSTKMFSATVPGGTWAASNLNATVSDAGLVKGTGAGTVTIIYTTSNAWCSAATTQTIMIDTFPDAGVITGPTVVCLGEQITLSNTVTGGSWSSSNGITGVNNGVVTGIVAGSDYVNYSVTNSCGTATTTRLITVHPMPETPKVTIDKGVLSATKGYASYQWKFNGSNIPGAVSDTFYADAAGTYEVVVMNSFGCSAGSGGLEYLGCSPGDMRVYPNPTNGVVLVEWCKKVSARVISVDGKEVGVAKDIVNLEIHNIPAGVYLLVVYDMNGIKVRTYKIVMLQ